MNKIGVLTLKKMKSENISTLKPLPNQNVHRLMQELKEMADYSHQKILKKIEVKKLVYPQVIHNLKKMKKINHFNNVHADSVNCIDICPFGKLLVSASNDGTIKMIDLEALDPVKDLVIRDRNNRAIKSVCIDDKHTIAYVNQDNVLRMYSIDEGLITAEYHGDKMDEYNEFIPTKACQFTSDFNYICFRSSSKKVTIFDVKTKQIVKEINTNELI